MQRKALPYQQLKKLTHRFVDVRNNGEYEIVCRKFEPILIELANDLLANSHKSLYYGNKHKRYLRILASNMERCSRHGIVRRFKEFLDGLGVEDRLYLLKHLGEFLIIMAYGRDTYFFSNLDKDLEKNNGKDKTQKDEKHYPYIAYDTVGFINHVLTLIHEKFGRRKSFVDVGCGIGDKVFLAWLSGIFDECVGIEYEGFTSAIGMNVAQGSLSRNRPSICINKTSIVNKDYSGKNSLIDFGIVNANAFDLNYRRFDTIYLYQPIANHKLLITFYEHIFKTMPAKAILLEMLQNSSLKRAVENINEESLGHTSYGGRGRYFYKTTTNKLRRKSF